MILKGYLFSLLYGVICLALGLIAYKLGAPKKYSRKIVHMLVGFEWVILYHYFGEGSAHFLAVCLAFTALLAFTYRKQLLPMISSEGSNAPGTVYYGVAMSVMAIICLLLPEMTVHFGIGVFCTSLGDGVAGIVGQAVKRGNPKIYGEKSLLGTLSGLAVCVGVLLLFREVFSLPLDLWHCLIVAIFACELELFMGGGLDNLTVTIGSATLAYALCYYPDTADYLLPIILTPLAIAVVYRKKALSVGGILGAVLLDICVSVAFGNFGFALLVTFLACGVLADRVKSRIKGKRSEKHECRDLLQVFSNGFAAMLAAALYMIEGNFIFLAAFVASMAEALADTVASGIGAGAKRVYDVFRFRPIESGLSGGMSVLGTASGAVAAHLVSLVALAFGRVTYIEALIITGLAFLGCILDSLFGSLIQAKYRCPVCDRTVEVSTHCGAPTERVAGLSFIDNNAVNFISNLLTAAITAVLFALI